jgi:hypothetical protein
MPEPDKRPGPHHSCIRLPTDKVISCLLGAGQLGRAAEPLESLEASEGWLWWRFEGLDGDSQGVVGTTVDDAEAMAGLERLRTHPKGMCELGAIMVAATAADGKDGEWCLERAASLLYGPRDQQNSHRERQLPGLKAILALCERGVWRLDGRRKADQASSKASPKGRGAKTAPEGGEVTGQLVTIERLSRSRSTLHLAPALAG